MLHLIKTKIVMSEIPGELSLSLAVSGCPHGCGGCFWEEYRNQRTYSYGMREYEEILKKHVGLVTCVLFMGGDWVPELSTLLKKAKEMGFKTALYTGLEEYPHEYLDYLKTGPFIQEKGPLGVKGTNQKLICVKTGERLR